MSVAQQAISRRRKAKQDPRYNKNKRRDALTRATRLKKLAANEELRRMRKATK